MRAAHPCRRRGAFMQGDRLRVSSPHGITSLEARGRREHRALLRSAQHSWAACACTGTGTSGLTWVRRQRWGGGSSSRLISSQLCCVHMRPGQVRWPRCANTRVGAAQLSRIVPRQGSATGGSVARCCVASSCRRPHRSKFRMQRVCCCRRPRFVPDSRRSASIVQSGCHERSLLSTQSYPCHRSTAFAPCYRRSAAIRPCYRCSAAIRPCHQCCTCLPPRQPIPR